MKASLFTFQLAFYFMLIVLHLHVLLKKIFDLRTLQIQYN